MISALPGLELCPKSLFPSPRRGFFSRNSALPSQALRSLLFLEADGIKQSCMGLVAVWDCQRCPHTRTQLWKEEGLPDFHPSIHEDLQNWVSLAGSQLNWHQLASLGWSCPFRSDFHVPFPGEALLVLLRM